MCASELTLEIGAGIIQDGGGWAFLRVRMSVSGSCTHMGAVFLDGRTDDLLATGYRKAKVAQVRIKVMQDVEPVRTCLAYASDLLLLLEPVPRHGKH